MNAEQYLKERVDNQIKWYSDKSKLNQTRFKYFRFLEITFAALIPFFSGYIFMYELAMTIVVGSLGVLVTILAGLLTLNKFQEKWIGYRMICENLKKEKHLYLTSSSPYHGEVEKRFQLFVIRIEALISNENTDWSQYTSLSKGQTNGS